MSEEENPTSAIVTLSGGSVEDCWSESDATPDDIDDALRHMLRERYAATDGALAPARVLNLVVIVEVDAKERIAQRLSQVGRYHASRTVLCAVEPDRGHKLAAWAAMAYDEPGDGLGVIHEQVEIDLGREQLPHLDTVIDPVIVSELPTVLWSPQGYEEAVDSLRRMVDVMLLDSDEAPKAAGALERAEDLLSSSYVVDLAWLRTTPWRERLASSFDPPYRRAALDELDGITIRHHEGSETCALLLAGWLAARLGWEPQRLKDGEGGRWTATAKGNGKELEIVLEHAEQDVPGLAGVTVSWAGDHSLSLDRGAGGLRAREKSGEEEREWQILGASRGEGGILGEGVRQAHLRDPTYGPALQAARELCPG